MMLSLRKNLSKQTASLDEPHPRSLSIGILPNQLRTLLKDTGHQHREEALDDLSRTLFFSQDMTSGQKGSALPSILGEIAPENRNIYRKNKET